MQGLLLWLLARQTSKTYRVLNVKILITFRAQSVFTYLRFLELDIVSACFATAGTVHLDVFKLANNHWTINKSDVAKTLNGVTIKWINDFTAQAFATTTLTDSEVITLNKGIVEPEKLKVGYRPRNGARGLWLIMSPSRLASNCR